MCLKYQFKGKHCRKKINLNLPLLYHNYKCLNYAFLPAEQMKELEQIWRSANNVYIGYSFHQGEKIKGRKNICGREFYFNSTGFIFSINLHTKSTDL